MEFPLSGWSFTASFVPAGKECGRIQEAPLTQTGDGSFVLLPIGHADTYDVTLFGRGNGDLFVTFRWTTPIDGPLPQPEARLAVLAGHDGKTDSYGVELEVSNLARNPEEAVATITVRAETGAGDHVRRHPSQVEMLARRNGLLGRPGPTRSRRGRSRRRSVHVRGRARARRRSAPGDCVLAGR